MDAHIHDIAVIGAGPVGASLALGLARLGLDTLVIDNRDPARKPSRDIRNFAIVSGNRDFLATIGVTIALEETSQPLYGLEAVDGGTYWFGQPSVLFADTRPQGGPIGHMIPADRLQAALDRAMATQMALTRLVPECFTGLDHADDHVIVHLQDRQPVKTRLVVGADGTGSPVRTALGIGIEQHECPRSVFTANVKTDRPHHGIARQLFTPDGPFATLPLKNGHINLAWYLKRGAAETLVAQPAKQVERELNTRFSTFAGQMSMEGSGHAWPLKLQVAERIIDRRAALIGDAARRVNPLAGQGLNQGLRDSATLLEIIQDTWRTGGVVGSGQMLERYSRMRRFDSSLATLALDGIDRLFANDWPVSKSLRRLGFMAVSHVPGLRQRLVRMASGLS